MYDGKAKRVTAFFHSIASNDLDGASRPPRTNTPLCPSPEQRPPPLLRWGDYSRPRKERPSGFGPTRRSSFD